MIVNGDSSRPATNIYIYDRPAMNIYIYLSSNMHMRSLNKNNRNKTTNIISSYGACVYMLLVPWYQVLSDSSTCCCQHIDHVDNRLFLHQNGKGVVVPLRSKISLYERCNRKENIETSLKLHKKLRI